jgi:hypothetical protein
MKEINPADAARISGGNVPEIPVTDLNVDPSPLPRGEPIDPELTPVSEPFPLPPAAVAPRQKL